MNLALIYGGKAQKIAETIKSIKDNLQIDCFKDISEFIDSTLKRKVTYDRLIMPTTVVNEQTLNELEQFWRKSLYDTSIVLLCKKDADEAIGTYFKQHFVSTNVCAMFVDASQKNSAVLTDAVSSNMSDLNSKYGIDLVMNLEDEDGISLTPPTNSEPQMMPNNMGIPNDATPMMQNNGMIPEQPMPTEGKKGHKSLFGKKKKVDENNGMPMQNNGMPMQNNGMPMQNNGMPMQNNGMLMQNNGMPMQNNGMPMQNNGMPFALLTPDMSTWPTPDSQGTMPMTMPADTFSEPTGFSNEMPYQNNMDMSFNNNDMSFSNNNDMSYQNNIDMALESLPDTNSDISMLSNTNLAQDDINNDMIVSSEKEESVDTPFNSADTEVNSPLDNISDVNTDDFGSVAFGDLATSDMSHKLPTVNVDEVSEDLGGIDLSGAESAYRAQNEQPKIITKEVVREVIRDSGGSGGIVNSILSGKNPHVLIVTGDRGTGITSTCLSIASFFCKKTSVLYFDCDTHTHGVLSYINYEEFRNFEPTKMSGTKICKSSKVFNNCVCKFDDNFDIISSDYSVDVTSEELTCTASVIAEKVVDYGLVIVDCPAENLHCISDLLISGNTIVCVDASKRGFMNMLCALEASTLSLRYKKLMVNKGIMFLTKYAKNIDVKRIVAYVKSIYEPEGVDWLSMHSLPFMGKVDMKILDRVFTK